MRLFILPLMVVLVGLAGCGRSSLPPGSVRIAAHDVFTDDQQRVTVITVESASSQAFSVSAGRNVYCGRSGMTLANDGRTHRAEIWVSATHLAFQDKAYVQTIIRSGGIGKTVREVPSGSGLDDTIKLTIPAGVHAVNSPIPLGRLGGEALLLKIGPGLAQLAGR